jgi:hypothetical protein
MALSAGAVVAKFDANIGDFLSGVKKAENSVTGFVRGVEKNTKNVGKSIEKIGGGMASLGSKISLAMAPGIAAFSLFSKQAFDQVKQVQNASAGLRAYEKDAGKVSRTLAELVAFAQSDMGVLFQRQDLFDAASTLKLFGANTDDLVKRVKIMSKAVAGGKTTFQDLSTILGRVSATGKLTATDFDMLIERGIGLDKKMRGTSISAEKLFQALDKSLPDELLEGRATSIEGQMIRLRSAMRNLGAQILGVNKEADGFMPNSLGARIIDTIDKIRGFMRSKEVIDAVTQAGQRLGQIFDFIAGIVQRVWTWYTSLDQRHQKLIVDMIMLVGVLGPVLIMFGTLVIFVGKVVGVIGSLIGVFGTVIAIGGKIVAMFGALASVAKLVAGAIVLITLPASTIAGIIGALIAVTYILWKRWGDVVNIFHAANNATKGLLSTLAKFAIPAPIRALFEGFRALSNVKLPGGFKIPGFANGVRNFGGGLAVVGERGPELVNLPKGSDVFSNEESRRMAGGQGITIETMNIKSGVDWEVGASYLAQKLRLS